MRRVITTEGPPADTDGVALDTPPFAALAVSAAEPERLRTEFEFELPRGFMDSDGRLHKGGAMRLATARDELLPLMDDRVRRNNAYLTVVLLGRVIIRLGSLSGDGVTADVIEGLFASDLAFLQDLYRRINTEGHTQAAVACPSCHETFMVDMAGGLSGAE
jgi:hypothetical protein